MKDLPKGLILLRGYLNGEGQHRVLSEIDKHEWSRCLRRRTQQFGYLYDYKKRRLIMDADVPPLPQWAEELAARVRADLELDQVFDQLIVNEYVPGQGITPHIDSEACFDNKIFSISLGSACVMGFSRKGDEREVFIQPGDLILLQDEVRYEWRHYIESKRSDYWGGQRLFRGKRTSVTFRRAVLSH